MLRTILTSQAPSTRGLPFVLWNHQAVHGLIELEFGIDMPIRTVGEYLMRWGYTPQRPTRCALEQKPWDVQRWIQEVYPLIASKVKQEDGIIYWADETACQPTHKVLNLRVESLRRRATLNRYGARHLLTCFVDYPEKH